MAILLALAACGGGERVVVGSKNFTEQDILGEIVAQQIERRTGLIVERRFHLGGTFVCHRALTGGEIDLYVEYTGTALVAILEQGAVTDPDSALALVRAAYAERFGAAWLPPLGFDNTFAMIVRGADARRLGLTTISQAARHAPGWRAGFGYEFMERADGFAGLARAYALRFAGPPRVMDLGLTYRALADGQVDLIAGNSTDGQIEALRLFALADDRHYFPPYQAAPVVRRETLRRHPEVGGALRELAGTIGDAAMRRMNYLVDVEHRDIAEVARDFLSRLAAADERAIPGR
ncbi:MAG: ABC transporter substrate-binding protein [Gemmatimonadetes bacterium]|nr:ABC transporter substrate-binding protein [Gemmatimonadota bacterium]